LYIAGTFTTSGTSFLLTPTCGSGGDGGIVEVPGGTAKTGNTYTATATTFTLFSGTTAGNSMTVYAKQ
jgi:hypothetical protein